MNSRPSIDVGAILVMHDVIDWLELYACPSTVTFKYLRTKNSRMAADPRKPRTLNPAKIKAYTVVTCYKPLQCTLKFGDLFSKLVKIQSFQCGRANSVFLLLMLVKFSLDE